MLINIVAAVFYFLVALVINLVLHSCVFFLSLGNASGFAPSGYDQLGGFIIMQIVLTLAVSFLFNVGS